MAECRSFPMIKETESRRPWWRLLRMVSVGEEGASVLTCRMGNAYVCVMVVIDDQVNDWWEMLRRIKLR